MVFNRLESIADAQGRFIMVGNFHHRLARSICYRYTYHSSAAYVHSFFVVNMFLDKDCHPACILWICLLWAETPVVPVALAKRHSSRCLRFASDASRPTVGFGHPSPQLTKYRHQLHLGRRSTVENNRHLCTRISLERSTANCLASGSCGLHLYCASRIGPCKWDWITGWYHSWQSSRLQKQDCCINTGSSLSDCKSSWRIW